MKHIPPDSPYPEHEPYMARPPKEWKVYPPGAADHFRDQLAGDHEFEAFLDVVQHLSKVGPTPGTGCTLDVRPYPLQELRPGIWFATFGPNHDLVLAYRVYKGHPVIHLVELARLPAQR